MRPPQRISRSPVFVRGVQPLLSLSLPEWRHSRDFLQILKVPVCKAPACELLNLIAWYNPRIPGVPLNRGQPCRGANTGQFGNFSVFPVFYRVFWAVNSVNLSLKPSKMLPGAEDHLGTFPFPGVSQTTVKHSTWGQCPQVLAGTARKVAKSTRLCPISRATLGLHWSKRHFRDSRAFLQNGYLLLLPSI